MMNKIKSLMKKNKFLILDIETSPNIGVFWRPGSKQTITHQQIIKERKIMCISYKWAGHKKVTTLDWGLTKQDDTALLETISRVIESANVVIGQNSDRFDIPWIQGRLCMLELPPISNKPHMITLDTMKLAKGALGLNSYKLDYMSKVFGSKGKMRMGFDDWLDILLHKCPKAWRKMLKYCPDDVKETEKVLYKILPYVKLTGYLAGLQKGELPVCPECKGIKIKRSGKRGIPGGKQRYQCLNCWRSF